MKNDIDAWSNIRVFLTVLRAGSTLAASRELGLSQTTVARRVEALEHALGLVLFDRDTRGAHPTEAARALAAGAAEIEAAAARFAETAAGLARDASGQIRIAAPGPIFSKGFSAILADFSKRHPGVKFSLLPSDQAVDVGAGDADLAVLFTRRIDNPSLICRRVGVERTTFFASEQYVALNGLPRSRDDFRGQTVVGIAGDRLPPHVEAWIAERTRPETIAVRCENIASLVAAIQMGKGIGPLPVTLGDTVEDLVRCFDPPEELDLPVWLVVGPAAYRRPPVRALAGFLGPRLARLLAE